MIIPTKCFGSKELERETLKEDKKNCVKIGPCGLGNRAMYLNSFYIERSYYVVYENVSRVFKRIAMSKGGFTGKGVFGSMAYLVVTLRDGSEKQCHFKKEEDVDRFLGELKNKHPEIPTMSRKAEKKLEEAEAAEKARYIDDLSGPAEGAVKRLEEARSVLEERLDLSEKLAYAAKQKRIVDNIDPTYQIVAVVITVIAAAAAAFGIYAWIKGWGSATYLVLFGLAAIFFVAGSRILPTGRNNKAAAQKEWTAARNAMSDYLAPRRNFPVPPQYGHPIVLTRMIRVIREGRAETEEEAFELMKDDLKKLTSDVTVTQKEYDEVVKVKPMFLVCDYQ